MAQPHPEIPLPIPDPVVGGPPAADTGFSPMYYNSPETQLVASMNVVADDTVTATVQSGAQFIQTIQVKVYNWVHEITEPPPIPPPKGGGGQIELVIPRGPLILSGPTSTSDGTTPLAVKKNQCILVYATAVIPNGLLSAPGGFGGSILIKGTAISDSVAFSGTYLGTLIGSVVASPASLAPGQSTSIQVNDANGKPLSDPSITVIIQGVVSSGLRYLQFPTAGNRSLFVTASRGTLVESKTVTVSVTGTPVLFRTSLAAPIIQEVPMLQVVAGSDAYTAAFTVGNTNATRRVLDVSQGPTKPLPNVSAKDVAQSLDVQPEIVPIRPTGMASEFPDILSGLAPDQVQHIIPTHTISTPSATSEASLTLIPIGGFRTPLTATSYQWEFGDGSTATTQAPQVTHSYFSSIQPGQVVHNFHVTCKIVHDSLTVTSSLALVSPYGISRIGGMVVPPIVAPQYATFQHVAFQTMLIAYNLEAENVIINRVAYVPFSDDTTVAPPAPQFITMGAEVTIPAHGASALGIFVTPSTLNIANAITNGFTAIFVGQTASNTPVQFTRVYRIPFSDSGIPQLTLPIGLTPIKWDLEGALQAATSIVTQPGNVLSPTGGQAVDKATNIISITLSSSFSAQAVLDQLQSSFSAAVIHIALQTGALNAERPGSRIPLGTTKLPLPPTVKPQYDPLNPLPPAAGVECYPDDISDADQTTANAQQLVCQATSQTVNILLPSSFQNAQAGDVILSPAPVGDGDMIAAMFRALTPPQFHGHSGIMTANFLEVTNCTAVVDRITDNVNKDSLGIPTSLVGNIMEYGWPGTIIMSVDQAVAGINIYDPSGTRYSCAGFNVDSRGDDVFGLTPPMVVKPLAQNEAVARPKLRQVADLARTKGAQYDSDGKLTKEQSGCYYSFYCYTNPQISAGFKNPAGADAGWAQGMSGAVCSSFIWLCAKEIGLPLVTTSQYEKLSDFSAGAIQQGAAVDSQTLDGLIFYPEADRLQGAESLRQNVLNAALNQEDGLGSIPGINSTIAGPIADQLLNDFAFNNPNAVGSSQWQNPGVGHAVSPDNIRCWGPPYYGLSENLQYLEPLYEQYTISKWVKVVTWGTITGNVTYNGKVVPNAHVWWNLPSGDTYTDANGNYTLNKVPVGPYLLKAQAVTTVGPTTFMHTNGAGQLVTLTAANSNITQNLVLQDDPSTFRLLDLTYQISCNHSDGNPFGTHGVQTAGPFYKSAFVDTALPTTGVGYEWNYNSGGYFTIDYSWNFGLLADFSVTCTISGTMKNVGNSNPIDQYEMGPFTIPIGETRSGYLDMNYSQFGYTNGPADLTFSITNNQQTG
jgi:hypothetical protein